MIGCLRSIVWGFLVPRDHFPSRNLSSCPCDLLQGLNQASDKKRLRHGHPPRQIKCPACSGSRPLDPAEVCGVTAYAVVFALVPLPAVLMCFGPCGAETQSQRAKRCSDAHALCTMRTRRAGSACSVRRFVSLRPRLQIHPRAHRARIRMLVCVCVCVLEASLSGGALPKTSCPRTRRRRTTRRPLQLRSFRQHVGSTFKNVLP